eukprot:gene14224-1082_t
MKAIMMLSVVLLGTRLRGADAATTFESTVAGTTAGTTTSGNLPIWCTLPGVL